MNKIAAFMLLDFRSIPMFGRIAMSIFIAGNIAVFFETTTSAGALFSVVLIVLMIGNMFALAEKNRLETLHAILPLTRGDIVKARYLFLFFILAVIMLPPILIKYLFLPDYDGIYFKITFAFLTVSFLAAIMFPLYFKIGAGQTQGVCSLSGIIIFALFIISPGFRVLFLDTLSIISISPVMAAATGLILLCLSYLLSLKIYRTRDL